MKRLLLIFMLLSLMATSIVGCSNVNDDVQKEIANNDETEPELYVKNSAVMHYLYFEDFFRYVTDVVEGTFTSETSENGIDYYEFNVEKSLRGKSMSNVVTIMSSPSDHTIIGTGIEFSTYNIGYEIGQTYLLLLSRYSSVYTDGDVFGFASDSLIIPMNAVSSSSSSLDKMSLYGTKLSDHIKNQDTMLAISQGDIREFILNQVADNPLDNGVPYIKSTDINDVLTQSEYVLNVKIEELYMDSDTKDRVTYRCSVNEVLKGDWNTTDVTITFPINKVELGSSYIVAVKGLGYEYLIMSSKNSIYDLSCYESIIKIIDSAE